MGKPYQKMVHPRSLTASLPPKNGAWKTIQPPIWVEGHFSGANGGPVQLMVRVIFDVPMFGPPSWPWAMLPPGPRGGFWLRDFSHNVTSAHEKNWKNASENQVGLLWTKLMSISLMEKVLKKWFKTCLFSCWLNVSTFLKNMRIRQNGNHVLRDRGENVPNR